MNKRFWEIDFLRGIAIIMMVIFHFLWDFKYYYNPDFSLTKGFWAFFQIITASLFLFLVGVSLAISNNKSDANFIKNLNRGLKIFSFGLLITIITAYIFPNNFIIFGILHLIGTSIIILYPLAKFKYINLMLGVIFIITGNILKNYSVDFNWLLFLGVHPNTFNSIDYFPVFPWMGVVLIGIFFGNLLYTNSEAPRPKGSGFVQSFFYRASSTCLKAWGFRSTTSPLDERGSGFASPSETKGRGASPSAFDESKAGQMRLCVARRARGGNLGFPQNRRNFTWEYSPDCAIIKPICFLGKNSLVIYLLHQIVLFGLFSTINLL